MEILSGKNPVKKNSTSCPKQAIEKETNVKSQSMKKK